MNDMHKCIYIYIIYVYIYIYGQELCIYIYTELYGYIMYSYVYTHIQNSKMWQLIVQTNIYKYFGQLQPQIRQHLMHTPSPTVPEAFELRWQAPGLSHVSHISSSNNDHFSPLGVWLNATFTHLPLPQGLVKSSNTYHNYKYIIYT